MDGAKARPGLDSPEQLNSKWEEASRKMAAGQADGCATERLMPLRRNTVREELKQQINYHCQEIRRILDMLDNTAHAVLESPASDMHRLVKAING